MINQMPQAKQCLPTILFILLKVKMEEFEGIFFSKVVFLSSCLVISQNGWVTIFPTKSIWRTISIRTKYMLRYRLLFEIKKGGKM